jgi:hypothetical protein
MNDTIHGLPCPEGCVRVAVVGVIKGEEPLPFPVPSGSLLLVRDVIGSHVAWPKKWIIPKQPTKAKKKSRVDKKLFGKSAMPVTVPNCCKPLYKFAKDMMGNGMTITTVLDEDIFGMPKTLIILREHVLNLLELNCIGSGVIEAYMA